MQQHQFYEAFVTNLTQVLMKMANQFELLGTQLMVTEDFEVKWKQIAPEYMADAVPEVLDYPSVAIAWAGYLGMGIASLWEEDWIKHQDSLNTYTEIRTPRGFDAMDEYIMEEMMQVSLDDEFSKKTEVFFRTAANSAISLIQKEGFEPQSVEAFRIFADAISVFYRLGVSIALYRFGYRMHKQGVDLPN